MKVRLMRVDFERVISSNRDQLVLTEMDSFDMDIEHVKNTMWIHWHNENTDSIEILSDEFHFKEGSTRFYRLKSEYEEFIIRKSLKKELEE